MMIGDDSGATTARDLFDRHRRAVRRPRGGDGTGFIDTQMAALLIERVDDVTRQFDQALVIGARNAPLVDALRERCRSVTICEASAALAARSGAIFCDEDALSVDPESFDLVIWPGGLESVNALPDALLRCRFALRPDGLLIGAAVGDGSFPALRALMTAADAPRAIARLHPQLSLRTIGDVLQQCGLQLIVTDVERMTLAYRDLASMVADLRAAALTNVIAGPVHPIGKAGLAKARSAFVQHMAAGAGGKRLQEQVNIMLFSGWAPDPSQPQPARRGSAQQSLADLLPPPKKTQG